MRVVVDTLMIDTIDLEFGTNDTELITGHNG